MINAFRNSELPENDVKQQKRYREILTGSEAVLTICSVIKNTIKQTENLFDSLWLQRLIIPMKILEILLYNEE